MAENLVEQGGSLVTRVLGQFSTKEFWKNLAFNLLRDGVQRAISGVVNAIVDVFKGAIPPEHRKPSPSSVFDQRSSHGSYGSRYRDSSPVPVSSHPTHGDPIGFPNLPANF